HWTVADQLMKKEVILQGMGWGHMPAYLVSEELRAGRLLSISGKHFPVSTTRIVAARRGNVPQGPIARRLWRFIEEQRPLVRETLPGPRRQGRQRPRRLPLRARKPQRRP